MQGLYALLPHQLIEADTAQEIADLITQVFPQIVGQAALFAATIALPK